MEEQATPAGGTTGDVAGTGEVDGGVVSVTLTNIFGAPGSQVEYDRMNPTRHPTVQAESEHCSAIVCVPLEVYFNFLNGLKAMQVSSALTMYPKIVEEFEHVASPSY